jgi:hypothetical protein
MQDQVTSAALSALAQDSMTALPFTLAGLEVTPREERAPGRIARAASWVAHKLAALWRALPGPWPVKAALLVLCVAIPGPLDEIALLALAGYLAVRKARGARAA